MCNCGKRRSEFSRQSHAMNTGSTSATSRQAMSTSVTSFEYTGKSALSVTGAVTRTQYRFNAPGSRQNVDARDVAGLMNVPVLKRV